MKVRGSTALFIAVLILLLIAANIYQFNNPKVVTVSTGGQTRIDSTTWVRRSIYKRKSLIVDSLRKISNKLAQQVKSSNAQIASAVRVKGHLRTQLDSARQKIVPISGRSVTNHANAIDTTITFSRTFTDSLFRVESQVHLKNMRMWDDLSLHQLRPVKLNVITTVEPHDQYVLTYVKSLDFDSLQYKAVTSLKPSKERPTFWIGAASATVALGILKFLIQ